MKNLTEVLLLEQKLRQRWPGVPYSSNENITKKTIIESLWLTVGSLQIQDSQVIYPQSRAPLQEGISQPADPKLHSCCEYQMYYLEDNWGDP